MVVVEATEDAIPQVAKADITLDDIARAMSAVDFVDSDDDESSDDLVIEDCVEGIGKADVSEVTAWSIESDVIPENAYAVLGLPVNASPDEVKIAYRRLLKEYHPDRNRNFNRSDHFHLITNAGSMLRDQYHRMFYDLEHKIRTVSEEEFRDVYSTLRKRALHLVENMTETVKLKRQLERQHDGVIIHKALYGDLRNRGSLSVPPGGIIDVTVPTQCLVEASELVEHSQTKAFIEGYYDPCPSQPKQLFIRYTFRNVVHQICYDDKDEVRIPMRSHSLSRSDIPEKHLSSTMLTFPRRLVAEQRRSVQRLARAVFLRRLRMGGSILLAVASLAFLKERSWKSIISAWLHQPYKARNSNF